MTSYIVAAAKSVRMRTASAVGAVALVTACICSAPVAAGAEQGEEQPTSVEQSGQSVYVPRYVEYSGEDLNGVIPEAFGEQSKDTKTSVKDSSLTATQRSALVISGSALVSLVAAILGLMIGVKIGNGTFDFPLVNLVGLI